jgi:hypothetical protein
VLVVAYVWSKGCWGTQRNTPTVANSLWSAVGVFLCLCLIVSELHQHNIFPTWWILEDSTLAYRFLWFVQPYSHPSLSEAMEMVPA